MPTRNKRIRNKERNMDNIKRLLSDFLNFKGTFKSTKVHIPHYPAVSNEEERREDELAFVVGLEGENGCYNIGQ